MINLCFSFAHAQEGERVLPSFFNAQEHLIPPDVKEIKRLRFVTTVDFAPFNSINSSGYLAGYNIDLIYALCAELNLESVCQIEAVPFDDTMSQVKKGHADAIITGLAATPQTREDFDFTGAYLRLPARFMALRDSNFSLPLVKALKEQPVGVIQNTAHEKLLKAYFPEISIIEFHDKDTLFQALQEKKVKAVFGDGLQFSMWLNSKEGECCQLIGEAYSAPQFLGEGLRIAVPRDKPYLTNALDYALKKLERKGKLQELYLRYFPIGFY